MAVAGAVKTMIAVTVSVHPAAAHHGGQSVTVKPGDTLSSISKHVYGSAADWPALWWSNRNSVHDPGTIAAGQRLVLSDWHPVKPWLTRAALAATAPPPAAPQPATATAAVSSAAPAQAPVSSSYNGASGSFQACVIARESGGNASAVNPYSGAGGLYGFLPSTWQALGYSGAPQNAPVSVQNAAFAKEYAQSGGGAWSAYDGC
jgi:LysM repeat protein